MARPNLLLDAMGVIYEACDDVANLLIPFVQRRTNIDARMVEQEYRSASLGCISSIEFWRNVGLEISVEDEYLEGHDLTPGLIGFLETAREHVDSIWCLSNDVSEWSQKLRDRFDLEHFFDGFVISGDIGMRKPDVNIYTRFFEISGLSIESTLFVDDRPKNVEAASLVGISSIHFEEGGVGFDDVLDSLMSR